MCSLTAIIRRNFISRNCIPRRTGCTAFRMTTLVQTAGAREKKLRPGAAVEGSPAAYIAPRAVHVTSAWCEHNVNKLLRLARPACDNCGGLCQVPSNECHLSSTLLCDRS